jgi:hypothetical protein
MSRTPWSADTGLFRSGAIDTRESFSFKFDKPGTYHFTGSIHPRMVGTIVVQWHAIGIAGPLRAGEAALAALAISAAANGGGLTCVEHVGPEGLQSLLRRQSERRHAEEARNGTQQRVVIV